MLVRFTAAGSSQRFAANPPSKSKVSRAIVTNNNAIGRDHEYDTGRLVVALDILPVCFLSRDLLTRAAERRPKASFMRIQLRGGPPQPYARYPAVVAIATSDRSSEPLDRSHRNI